MLPAFFRFGGRSVVWVALFIFIIEVVVAIILAICVQ